MQIDLTPRINQRKLRLIAEVKRLPRRCHVEVWSEAVICETSACTLKVRQSNQHVDVAERSRGWVIVEHGRRDGSLNAKPRDAGLRKCDGGCPQPADLLE